MTNTSEDLSEKIESALEYADQQAAVANGQGDSLPELCPVSWGDLSNIKFPPVSWLVEDLLPPGASLLVGRPKQGKSWLVHTMLLLIAAGSPVFGKETVKASVLYMALEDSDRRLQERTRKIMHSHGIKTEDIKDTFHCVTEAGRLGGGFEGVLSRYLETHPNTRLIVIDVLAKIRGDRRPNQSLFQHDYSVGSNLKKVIDQYPLVSLIVVHHANKGQGDALDSVSGTNGLTAGVDNVFSLIVGPEGPELHINARDVEDSAPIPLERDETGMWTLAGREEAGKRSMSDTRLRVLQAVRDGHETPKAIAEATELDDNVVKQHLLRMVNRGVLIKAERGRYIVQPPYPFNTEERTA